MTTGEHSGDRLAALRQPRAGCSRPRDFWGRRIPSRMKSRRDLFKERRTTEYPANGSSIEPRPLVRSDYGQASRLISTSQLSASQHLHTWPITWSSSRSLQSLSAGEISSCGGFHA